MTEPREEPALARTPGLEALLQALRRALARQVLAYGIGTVLGVAALWLLFAFLADWGLHVPYAIRVFHGLVLALAVGYFAWRDLLRPLQSIPGRGGLAVLLERAHPELRELLISAVQFQERPQEVQGNPELVGLVLAEAESRSGALTPRGVIDPEAPRARLLLGSGAVLGLAVLASLQPLHARIFLERLLGGTTAWPQRTHLVLEIPGLEDKAIVDQSRERWRLRLARGSDLGLLVMAEGVTPEEVTLHFDGGREVMLHATGGNVFRTLLQSCQEDLAFHVTGGDDQDGEPRVEIQVLQPPDVEGIAVDVRPPSYSGLPAALLFDQDVEVLKGSELSIHVLPSPREAHGKARLLPDDTLLELLPAPFPRPASDADQVQPLQPGLTFTCQADKTFGFRVELTDANGLSNPEPGLYRIKVVEDRAPELTVLAPLRGEFETVRGGSIPLRVRVEDDFGLAALGWRIRSEDAGASSEPVRSADMELLRRTGSDSARAHDAGIGSARLEIDSLAKPEAPLPVDSRFVLEFFARDQHVPEANEGHSAPIRVRIVTPEELLRRLQDRLAQARLDAMRLSDEQREKQRRVEDLLDVLEGDDPIETGESLALSAALAGERRVLADAQALARGLASAAEDVLYARLDDKAAGLLEFYDARAGAALDARFDSEPWRALASESAAGRLPSDGFAANLVRLVGLALEISEDHAGAAVAALQAAEDATRATAVADNLVAASEKITLVLNRTEALLEELAEWDNFQNVLTLARDILNRQKALRDRTQQFATEK